MGVNSGFKGLTTYVRIFVRKVVVVHTFSSLPSCTQSKVSFHFL